MSKGKNGTGRSQKLRPQQEQFCREYLSTMPLNGTQAAIRAGYSKKTAESQASRLLSSVKIQERIEELKKKSISKLRSFDELEYSAEATLKEMNAISQSSLEAFFDIDDKGQPVLNLNKAKAAGLLGTLKKIKIKELPPVTILENGVELDREVMGIEVELWDKVRAGENMMKHHGVLQEKVEVAGMNDLINALHKGRERVAKLREEREKAKGKAE